MSLQVYNGNISLKLNEQKLNMHQNAKRCSLWALQYIFHFLELYNQYFKLMMNANSNFFLQCWGIHLKPMRIKILKAVTRAFKHMKSGSEEVFRCKILYSVNMWPQFQYTYRLILGQHLGPIPRLRPLNVKTSGHVSWPCCHGEDAGQQAGYIAKC